MSQGSSKHPANGAARSRAPTLARSQAKPAIGVRSRNASTNLRPFAQPQAGDTVTIDDCAGLEGPTRRPSAPCLQGYLQWAGFVAATQDDSFGFGAYFVGDESGARIATYTWTPSGRG
jgi:hypothetical protein